MKPPVPRPQAGSWSRTLLPIAAGQAVSLLGSGLSEFAISLWVYQQTRSVTQFAFVLLFRTLPVIALAPLAGVLADRWDRRRLMIVSDTGSALCVLALAALFVTGALQVWQVCLLTALSAGFGSLQAPAYFAAIASLVPQAGLGKVNGWIQLSQGVAEILVPVLAAALLTALPIPGILAIDVATFLVALVTLAGARFPLPAAAGLQVKGDVLGFVIEGLQVLRRRADLKRLLAFQATFAFLSGMLSPLLIPLFTGLTSVQGMGLVLTVAGGGFLLGSLALSLRGGRWSYHATIIVGSGLFGLALIAAGLVPHIAWVGAFAFIAHFIVPWVNGSSQALWLSQVDDSVQGRLQAVRQVVTRGLQPLALILAGLAADRVFEPALAAGGSLAAVVGGLIGVGAGRGAALLVACIGAATALLSLSYGLWREHRPQCEVSQLASEATPAITVAESAKPAHHHGHGRRGAD